LSDVNIKEACLLSLVSKIKKTQNGLIEELVDSPLEKIQLQLIGALLQLEEQIILNPYYDIEESNLELFSLSFDDDSFGSGLVLEHSI
jgi:hypothetical protein